MRKLMLPSALLSLCIALILFSDACLSAASGALRAWWERVLPALLPFSVFLSLSDCSGVFSLLERICGPIAKRCRISPALLPCMLFGALSGYPNGARLAEMRKIPADAAYCNFCSPVFLIGVVAHGLYQDQRVVYPLIIAHIGSVLLTVLPRWVFSQTVPCGTQMHLRGNRESKSTDFFSILRESLGIMASIGGCMVLFSVGIAIIGQLHLLGPLAAVTGRFAMHEPELLALLHGVFEFAGGCVSIAALALPLRIRIAMTAFTVTFGGLCVLMQSAMFLDAADLRRYAKIKIVQGILAGLLAYQLFPRFCPTVLAAMVSDAETLDYAANALSMGSILLSGCTVLLGFYLFASALARYLESGSQKQKKTRLF